MIFSSRPILQLVHIPTRNGYLPVMSEARCGEHKGKVLYALVQQTLSSEKWSIFGVTA